MISETDQFQIIDFVNSIILLWDEFPLSVTSWFRTPKRNKLKGGKEFSQHLRGLGIDVVLDDMSKVEKFYARINEYGLKFLNEGDHIHIQI